MARADIDPEDRDKVERLKLEAIVDCPDCDTMIDVIFVAPPEVYELEDLTEPPTVEIRCPNCDTVWVQEYEGWMQHQDQA